MANLREIADDARRARAGETIVPAFQKAAFHCAWCQVFAPQEWLRTFVADSGGHQQATRISRCECSNCHADSYWIHFEHSDEAARMLYPRRGGTLDPHPEMPEDVRADYEEAASILDASPRGSGALLRLALQKLMPHLGEAGKNLNADIASLVKKGLDPDVQRALDALRVIGANAVHPLELDLRDDTETVGALFGLLNFIVEDRIARPKKLEALYDALPESARKAIDARDAAGTAPTPDSA